MEDTVKQAGANLERAKTRFQDALAMARADDLESDTREGALLTLRGEDRAYALAITEYSSAAMQWLIYIEKHLRPKVGGAGTATSGSLD